MELPITTVVPVIISGGLGSRLWPLSREAHPKPFIKLSDGQSLLQKAYTRALRIRNVHEIVVVTRDELYYQTKYDLEENRIDSINTSYILEPIGRNTAPAILMTALQLASHYDKQTIMAVLPADHLIPDSQRFSHYANKAIALAQQGFLVTLGVKQTRVETSYGYLEIAREAFADHDCFRVDRFIEKPNFKIAETFLASKKHYWNTGMFFFSIETLLNEFSSHADHLLQAANHCFKSSGKKIYKNGLHIDANTFTTIPSISIDYALMEKSSKVATVICDFVWDDIGTFRSLSNLIAPNENGNQIVGESMCYDTTNCYIHSANRLIGTVGVDNLMIVDTADAMLVVKRDRVQDVKQLVDLLKADDSALIKYNKQIHRPWGHYTVISESAHFKIKFIHVKPGAALSLQMHYHRSEHWIVVAGLALVLNGDEQFTIKTNESTFIPKGRKHRLENLGTDDLIIVEVQCGDYLGEDDIVRFEDKYERVLT